MHRAKRHDLPSLRTMRLNIWRALLCASDTEITEGMSFYEGAHGLCELIAATYKVSVSQAAGIYAALSPLNTWDTNVANVFDILRDGSSATVNTPHANKRKALQIAEGADPLDILKGNKVRAFYRAIADLSVRDAVPVDRHLVCLALGTKITANKHLSRIIGLPSLYSQVERAYLELGEREGIGNRLASIAWFVQRRVESGQQLLPHPDSPFCCGRSMNLLGNSPRRYRCPACKHTCTPLNDIASRRTSKKFRKVIDRVDGYDVCWAAGSNRAIGIRSRKIIYLGVNHQFANSGGWQYLSRYLVMRETGQLLRSDEHVDHINQDKLDDRLDNFRVMLAESHGRHHVYLAELAGGRGPDGRFQVYTRPIDLTGEVPF